MITRKPKGYQSKELYKTIKASLLIEKASLAVVNGGLRTISEPPKIA